MPIEQTIEADVVAAMKEKNALKLSTLRMVKAAISNYKIEKRKESLSDAEIIEIVQKQVKQRKESIDSIAKANRKDLADKETAELEILKQYLPQELSDVEIKTLTQQAIAKSGAKTKAELGKVMKELMPAVKGRADGKKVNEIVLSLLA